MRQTPTTNPPETLLQKLRKLEALATSGIDGEKVKARTLLNQLCQKYGVTLDQLTYEDKTEHVFTCRGKYELTLLTHCALYVCRTRQIRNSKWTEAGHTKVSYWVTKSQAIDIRDCFTHFKRVWHQNLDDMISALIIKHNLFSGETDDDLSDDDEADQSQEERDRLRRIAAKCLGIDTAHWQRRRQLAASIEAP